MRDTFHKFVIGVAGPTMGYAVDRSTTEQWLGISSLVIGIIVGVLSAISIAFSIRKKWLNYKSDKKHGLLKEETTTV